MAFLPTTVKEMRERGWDRADIILFTGDAYIDHPAFGAAVIGRLLEAEGYSDIEIIRDYKGLYRYAVAVKS